MQYKDFVNELAKEFKATEEAKKRNITDTVMPQKMCDLFLRVFVDLVQRIEDKDDIRLYNTKNEYVGKFMKRLHKGRKYNVLRKSGNREEISTSDTYRLDFKRNNRLGK